MAQHYRLVGSQDPANRIDRWVVESPSDEHPDGKVLEVGGHSVELSQEQYSIGSRFLRLEPVTPDPDVDVQFVDQPGVNQASLSSDVPPDPGTTPDVENMNADQLRDEARRVGADVKGNAPKDELKKAITDKRAEA